VVTWMMNLAAAYAAGAWAEIQATKDAFPYLEYLAVNDDRTRPAHAVLDGKAFPVDHEFWDHNFPPNGFGCRCATAPVSKWRAEKKGVKVETEIPSGLVFKGENGFPVPVAAPGADPGFTQNVGKDWLAGLTPQELDGALNFGPARTICPVGGEFADPEGPCGLPLDLLIRRQPQSVLEIKPEDILPEGRPPEFYALEFLKAFGINDLNGGGYVILPNTWIVLPINLGLLTIKKTGELKADKFGRGAYMRLLAETIKNPFEIWKVPASLSGRRFDVLRLIRLFRDPEGREIGGFGVFNWIPGQGWQGATAFTPSIGGSQAEMRQYLDDQRRGALIYREK